MMPVVSSDPEEGGRRLWGRFAFRASLLLAFLLSACGGDTPNGPPPRSPVIPGAVSKVSLLSPSATGLSIGEQTRFIAVAFDAAGNMVQVSAFLWSISDPNVASVTSIGVVSGLQSGSATLTASFNGIASNTAQIIVTLPPNAIRVTPLSATVTVGSTQQFIAVAEDVSGNPIPGVTFAWTASDPTVATVDASGLATGLKCGNVKISAAATGLAGPSASLTVNQPPTC